jgi:antirestriction protein
MAVDIQQRRAVRFFADKMREPQLFVKCLSCHGFQLLSSFPNVGWGELANPNTTIVSDKKSSACT